ncbi:MAG: O-antigen ligase family protein [Ilumatobacter sp.]|uniref:O-antigen ligase family protein n=1 Tax=Ilumatobacter sp. TaxID=1967498 RepID=UPI0026327BE3|nr:O-antigen ligase family protein [Ilumatobacter sp.]MDJ0768638.1 O-antigen ligase family protein [Ilumatobacter sp.]
MTSAVTTPHPGGALDRAWRASSAVDRAVVAWVFGSLAWFVPVFRFDWWTPRLALLVGALPVGLWAAWRLIRTRDRATIAAAAFAAWLVIGAALSSSPWLSLKGATGRDYSALTLIGALSMWAIGRMLPKSATKVIGPTVIGALGLSVIVGTYQVLVGIATGLYASSPSRASGLLVNPVYFGSMAAGAAAYAAAAHVAEGRRWTLLALAAAAYGVMLSGSRVALFTTLVIVAVVCLATRTMRSVWSAAATVCGLGLGYVVSQIGDGRSSVDRFGVGTEGRLDVWRYGIEGVFDRPLTGTGIGFFREGVQEAFTIEFVRDETALGRQSWADPHNLVILILVSTGIVGLALFLAFAFLSIGSSRGPLLALFLGIAASWLLQPTPILTAPTALLVLGAAAPRLAGDAPQHDSPPVRRRWPLYAGLVLVAYVGVADLSFRWALRADDEAGVETSRQLFVGDPAVEAIVASWHLEASDSDPDRLADAIDHAHRAAELENSRPIRWVQVARLQVRAMELPEARANLERAVELQPTELAAWLALVDLAAMIDDDELSAEASRRSCELLPSCAP